MQVMRDCSADLGMHQEDLLQEVARVMARPAKPDSEAGKRSKAAAKELLRTYGRAAASAFRAVQREGRPQTGLAASSVTANTSGLPPNTRPRTPSRWLGTCRPSLERPVGRGTGLCSRTDAFLRLRLMRLCGVGT